jgi:nucleotide-binding universal stress UspA family protein
VGNCILCGIDDSAGARRGASVTSRLARDLGSRALLVHVVDETGTLRGRLGVPRFGRSRKMRRRLAAVAEEHCFPKGTWIRLEAGDPVSELIDTAKEEDAELVVVAARRQASTGAALLGGVTSALMRQAPCPVVVVPTAAIEPVDSASIKDVVCGVKGDGSDRDIAVLSLAADLAARLGGKLSAVHGYEPGTLPAQAAGPRHRLQDVLRQSGIETDASVVPLDATEALEQVAEQQRAGLIVVGSPRDAADDSPLPGSVAIRLAAEGSTALVVLPTGAELVPASGHYELVDGAA